MMRNQHGSEMALAREGGGERGLQRKFAASGYYKEDSDREDKIAWNLR